MPISMNRTRFAVPDIRCDRCKAAIEAAVAPLPGVESVDADVAGWVVRVDHDPARADAAAIALAIEGQGYPVVERYEEIA